MGMDFINEYKSCVLNANQGKREMRARTNERERNF